MVSRCWSWVRPAVPDGAVTLGKWVTFTTTGLMTLLSEVHCGEEWRVSVFDYRKLIDISSEDLWKLPSEGRGKNNTTWSKHLLKIKGIWKLKNLLLKKKRIYNLITESKTDQKHQHIRPDAEVWHIVNARIAVVFPMSENTSQQIGPS